MVKMSMGSPVGGHRKVVNFEHMQLLLSGLSSKNHEIRISTLNNMKVVPVQLDPRILNILISDTHISQQNSHSVRVAAANASQRALNNPKRTPQEKAVFMKPLIDALEAAVYSEDQVFANSVIKALSLLKGDFITPDIVEDSLAPKVVNMLQHSSPIVSLLGIAVSSNLWKTIHNDERVIGALIMLSHRETQGVIGTGALSLLRKSGYS